MPLVNISLRSIYTPGEKQAIHSAIHEALVESFKIPEHDFHHRMHTFEECDYPIAPGKTVRSLLIENPLQNWGFGGRSAAKIDLGFKLNI